MDDSTGIPAVDTIVVWSVAIVAVGGLLGLAWKVGRGVQRIAASMDQFLDDWRGQPPRPGVPKRPGVMERISGIEHRLERVEHELHPNSGTSMRDAIDRVEEAVGNSD